MLNDFANDVRYAARTLRNARVVTIATVLTLGIGIGLLTAIFSIVNAAVLRPLPYEEARRLVALSEDHPRAYSPYSIMSPAAFAAVRDRSRSFAAVAAYHDRALNAVLGTTGIAEQLRGADVTIDLFSLLRVAPLRGRLFTADEANERSSVVVISHELWTVRLGASDRVVGSTFRIDGVPHVVIGVMPAGFNFPERHHFWRPLLLRPDNASWLDRSLSVVARLRDGVEVQTARAELATIGAAFAREHPANQDGWSMVVRPELIERRAIPGPLPWMVLAAGLFLMLIACSNVATVLLARAASRRGEMAVRAALGASRRRLVRQHLTETLLLALAGGVAGVLIATWMLDIAWAALPTQSMPSWIDLGIDWRVLAFTSGASFAALLVVGIGPALTATRVRLSDPLKLGAAGDTASRHELRASRVLVVVEVAAAFVLFAGSTLMLQSVRSLQRFDFGIQADRVLVTHPTLSTSVYTSAARRASYFEAAIDRVRRLAGVSAVATRGQLDSLRGAGWTTDSLMQRVTLVSLGGTPTDPAQRARPDLVTYVVTPSYFDAVRLPLTRGRPFTARDDSGSTRVAVISTLVANRLWPNADPVGRQFRFGASAEWLTVAGVSANVRVIRGGARGTTTRPEAAVYLPAAQATSRNDEILVHASDPVALAPAVARALRAVDPEQSIGRMERLSEDMGSANRGQLWIGVVVATIAVGALVLASIGLYGVIAYSVARRTREIGVRMALGADSRVLRRTVIGQALRLTSMGLGIGFASAWGLTRLTGAFLSAASSQFPIMYPVVAVVFLGVGALASVVPARRATRVDPLIALRAQ